MPTVEGMLSRLEDSPKPPLRLDSRRMIFFTCVGGLHQCEKQIRAVIQP